MSTSDNTIAHSSYFDGQVQSLSLDTTKGRATVGVIKPGSYTFGTAAPEVMVIISGELSVKLPDAEWIACQPQQSFNVAANQSFHVSCKHDVAYICYYG